MVSTTRAFGTAEGSVTGRPGQSDPCEAELNLLKMHLMRNRRKSLHSTFEKNKTANLPKRHRPGWIAQRHFGFKQNGVNSFKKILLFFKLF